MLQICAKNFGKVKEIVDRFKIWDPIVFSQIF